MTTYVYLPTIISTYIGFVPNLIPTEKRKNKVMGDDICRFETVQVRVGLYFDSANAISMQPSTTILFTVVPLSILCLR